MPTMVDLNAVERTVASITMTGGLDVTFRGVKVITGRLNSPYLSHRSVRYEEGGEYEGLFISSDSGFSLAIGAEPPAPAWGLKGYVGEWVSVQIATEIIKPALRRAEEVTGLRMPRFDKVVNVWVLRPRLVGWAEGKPVYLLADYEGNPRVIDAEVVGELDDGFLTVWRSDSYHPIGEWEWFAQYDRYIYLPDGKEDRRVEKTSVFWNAAIIGGSVSYVAKVSEAGQIKNEVSGRSVKVEAMDIIAIDPE